MKINIKGLRDNVTERKRQELDQALRITLVHHLNLSIDELRDVAIEFTEVDK